MDYTPVFYRVGLTAISFNDDEGYNVPSSSNRH